MNFNAIIYGFFCLSFHFDGPSSPFYLLDAILFILFYLATRTNIQIQIRRIFNLTIPQPNESNGLRWIFGVARERESNIENGWQRSNADDEHHHCVSELCPCVGRWLELNSPFVNRQPPNNSQFSTITMTAIVFFSSIWHSCCHRASTAALIFCIYDFSFVIRQTFFQFNFEYWIGQQCPNRPALTILHYYSATKE